MVRKYPVLFIVEVDSETHKIICNRDRDEFTIYFDDKEVGNFRRESLRGNFEYIFNAGGHEYCLFFYSSQMIYTKETAKLIIDGRYTDKSTDGKYRIETATYRRYPYIPEKDTLSIIIAVITVIVYIAALIIAPPFKDTAYFVIDMIRTFGSLYLIIGLVGFYKYPIVGISKRVQYSSSQKVFGIIASIMVKSFALIYVVGTSFISILMTLQK